MTHLLKLGFARFRRSFEDVASVGQVPARVAEVFPSGFRVLGARGRDLAVLSGSMLRDGGRPVVGDWVVLAGGDGAAVIEEVLPRRALLSRKRPGKTSVAQPLVANVDRVVIVTTPGRDFNPHRLERFMAVSWEAGATPIIAINKSEDLVDREALIDPIRASAGSVPIILTSATTGLGIEALLGALPAGDTVVLMGTSGVGKSTLLNRIAGNLRVRTQDIRESDEKGRHTTTTRSLWCARERVFIDTPGVRELGLVDAGVGLGAVFADIDTFAANCRFRDCRHTTEPGCAVREAVARGELDGARVLHYLDLDREQEAAVQRSDARAARAQGRKMGRQIREAKAWRKMRRGR